MSALVVIPARYNSVRFPGKPLAIIAGKSMIRHVYERAKAASHIKEVFVATDDYRIYSAVEEFGGIACMTSDKHLSGTDRVAEALEKIDTLGYSLREEDVVINVQGDEPLIDPKLIDELALLMSQATMPMATFAKPIYKKMEIENPNVVKVVFDMQKDALYFSRSPIPFQRGDARYYKHIGIYGYRKGFLKKLTSLPQTPLEQSEQLEQLRAIENGYKIRIAITESETLGVDVPEDIERVEKWIKNSSL